MSRSPLLSSIFCCDSEQGLLLEVLAGTEQNEILCGPAQCHYKYCICSWDLARIKEKFCRDVCILNPCSESMSEYSLKNESVEEEGTATPYILSLLKCTIGVAGVK